MSREATRDAKDGALLIACGALAREIVEVIRANRFEGLTVTCLPAQLHNRPERIPEAVRAKIRAGRARHRQIYVLYGDCGTGGLLDRVLEEEQVTRIDGPHCYAFFSGVERFLAQAEAEPAVFYLTDYLARHFERLIVEGLGLDRHPELRDDYFGNYEKLVYLSQSDDPELLAQAKAAAERLGLAFEHRWTGMGELGDFVARAARGAA